MCVKNKSFGLPTFFILGLLTACGQSPDAGPSASSSGSGNDVTNTQELTGPGSRSAGFVPDPDSETTYTEKEVQIEMSDGVTILATQYVPEGIGRVPTAIQFSPYGRNANASGGTNNYLSTHGYAELVVDVRGTGASGGVWELWSEAETRDFAEVIQWVTEQDYSDGQVALIGASYSAISALHATIQEDILGVTEAVKALFIRVPLADAYRDIATLGGAPNTGFLSWWSTGFIGGPSSVQPLLGEEPDPITTAEHASQFFTTTLPLYFGLLYGDDENLPPQLSGGNEGAFDSEWYQSRSPLRQIDRITVPTFIVAAQYDIFQRTQPMLYNALNLSNEEKKLLLVSDYHIVDEHWFSSNDGSVEVRDDHNNTIASENNLRLAWLDRWTKGKHNGVTKLPTETYYFNGNPTARSFQDGVPEVTPRRFYLQPNTPASLQGGAGAGTLENSLPSEAGSFDMPFQPDSGQCSRMPIQYLAGVAPDDPNCSVDNRVNEQDAWNFTTAPFAEDTKIFGAGNLRLWIRSTAADAQLVAFLTDVSPDGLSTQVSFGQLIASHRKLVETPCETEVVLDCSVYTGDELIQPWHSYTQEDQESLTPGELYEVHIEINPAFMEIKTGHQLRLSVKTGNFPAANPTMPVRTNATGGVTTVISSPEQPSVLVLGTLP